MPNNPTLLLSFAAGILSFLSPCVFPLIPSYISFISGASMEELSEKRSVRGAFPKTLLFVLGFSTVFVVLGLIFQTSGTFLGNTGNLFNIIAGSIVIVLGLHIIFDFWKFLNFEKRMHMQNKPKGLFAPLFLGMAFGAGWSPCIGPILAGILFMAGQAETLLTGIFYLIAYSIGLGTPFLIASLFFSWFSKKMVGVKKHFRTIKIFSGIFLIFIGLLIIFGKLQALNSTLLSWGYLLQDSYIQAPQDVRFMTTLAMVGIGSLPLFIRGVRKVLFRIEKPFLGTGILVFLIIFALPAILNQLGIIALPELLSNWLVYQGL